MEKLDKTNAMRILDREGVSYEPIRLPSIPRDGMEAATMIGRDPLTVFKTLVTVGSDRGHYVFMVPVGETLDLKKAAEAAGVKSVEMLPQKELFPLTGYVHGGCSPIGMKKLFPTYLDEIATACPDVVMSAGKLGVFLRLSPDDLIPLIGAKTADLVRR